MATPVAAHGNVAIVDGVIMITFDNVCTTNAFNGSRCRAIRSTGVIKLIVLIRTECVPLYEKSCAKWLVLISYGWVQYCFKELEKALIFDYFSWAVRSQYTWERLTVSKWQNASFNYFIFIWIIAVYFILPWYLNTWTVKS